MWVLVFKKCTGMQEVRTAIIESEYCFLPAFAKKEVAFA